MGSEASPGPELGNNRELSFTVQPWSSGGAQPCTGLHLQSKPEEASGSLPLPAAPRTPAATRKNQVFMVLRRGMRRTPPERSGFI